MKRILVIGVVLVVVLVVAAFVVLYSSLDAVVKAAIEKIGSDVTGTRVHVADVDISPTSGEGALRGFRVVNPDGFEREDAFRFDEITLRIDLTTLTSDPVVIEEVVIVRPAIRYEFGGRGTNVGEIQKNVEDFSAPQTLSSGPNVVIRNLYFRDGKINVAGASLLKKGVTTPLPDLHLTDIGVDENGATPAVVAREVFGALGRRVTTAVVSLDLQGLGRKTGEAAESGAKATGDALKSTGKKLKGLLGKDD